MSYVSSKKIEKIATDLLKSNKVLKIPIDLELLAHRLDLKVDYSDLGDDVSGLIVMNENGGSIGINEDHPLVRQRFSLAHEIGHFILHREDKELFIDKKYTTVFRDETSSSGEDKYEIQANAFAAALLMPKVKIKKYVKKEDLDPGDDESLRILAHKFKVSMQAMAYRISKIYDSDAP